MNTLMNIYKLALLNKKKLDILDEIIIIVLFA
jgi:hypothetical protein